jgi:hypothetical protein
MFPKNPARAKVGYNALTGGLIPLPTRHTAGTGLAGKKRFLARPTSPTRWTSAPRDQTSHKPRQSRTMARHSAFAMLAGEKNPAQFPHRT